MVMAGAAPYSALEGALPGIYLTVTVLPHQRPWRRYALYWVPFYSFLIYTINLFRSVIYGYCGNLYSYLLKTMRHFCRKLLIHYYYYTFNNVLADYGSEFIWIWNFFWNKHFINYYIIEPHVSSSLSIITCVQDIVSVRIYQSRL